MFFGSGGNFFRKRNSLGAGVFLRRQFRRPGSRFREMLFTSLDHQL